MYESAYSSVTVAVIGNQNDPHSNKQRFVAKNVIPNSGTNNTCSLSTGSSGRQTCTSTNAPGTDYFILVQPNGTFAEDGVAEGSVFDIVVYNDSSTL